MKKSKLIALLLALAMLVVLCACGTTAPVDDGEDSAAAPVSADSMNVCIASEPDTIDPALNSAVDGATLIVHLFSGLAGYSEDSKGNVIKLRLF